MGLPVTIWKRSKCSLTGALTGEHLEVVMGAGGRWLRSSRRYGGSAARRVALVAVTSFSGTLLVGVVAVGSASPASAATLTAGTVFIADAGIHQVVEVPAGGGPQSTVGSGVSYPFGVTVDAKGDVFIADIVNGGQVLEVPAGGGAQTSVGTGLNSPRG
jgi:hypothetical protein